MPILKNARHEKFAEELATGKSADEAYEIAGYKPDRGHASRLAANGSIAARVQEILGQSAERCGVTIDRITEELAKIGFADIRKAVRWGEGLVIKDPETGRERVTHDFALLASDQIDDRTAAAISEVRKTRDGISIRLHDKRAALVDLGRHLGMFPTKVEMTGKNGGPVEIVSKAQRDAAVKAALRADSRGNEADWRNDLCSKGRESRAPVGPQFAESTQSQRVRTGAAEV